MKKRIAIIQGRQIQKIRKLEGSDFEHLFEDVTTLKKPSKITPSSKEQNRDKTNDKKELTTRFFMVDTITGIPMGIEQKVPAVIRYLKKFTIQ